jgi:serine protease inhibitor
MFTTAHSSELGCRILDLPYVPSDATQISMIILLPDDYSIETVLRRLTPELLDAALQEDNEHEVELKLPKFTVEKTWDLRQLVSQMGFDIFSPSADFSDFSNKSVSFDEGVHKAKIELDENGSTAAAATAVFGFRSGFAAEAEKFDCNYPFIYIIFDHKEKSALFAGIYRGPEM